MSPPRLRREFIPSAQVCSAASFPQEFYSPSIQHPIPGIVQVSRCNRVRVCSFKIPSPSLVDQCGGSAFIARAQETFGEHILYFRETDSGIIRAPSEAFIRIIWNGHLYETYARVLFSFRYSGRQIGYGGIALAGADFCETPHFVHKYQWLVFVLFASVDYFSGRGQVRPDNKHAFITSVA